MTQSLFAKTASQPPPTQPQDTVSIIGLGYVGLPLALLAAARGMRVVGYDIDGKRIRDIRRGDVSYISNDERDALTLENFTATSDAHSLADARIHVICVPTPVSGNHEPDLTALKGACRTLVQHLKDGDLVVLESTVNPGVSEEVVLPILESHGKKVERNFFLAHCPERINPGDERWNVRTIPRVIGAAGPQSLAKAITLYQTILDSEVVTMRSLKEAEAVKMVENAFRDVNIAFVNELAMSFDRAGIDLVSVIRGASTKPFAFMPHFPGAGVGGHCIPVDPYYLIRYGHKNGFVHKFLITARAINNRMPLYTVTLLAQALRKKRKQLTRSTVALLGIAYKRDVADERESPSHAIREQLEKRGVSVRTFDPYVLQQSNTQSLEEALRDADAAIIATDHSVFRSLTPFHFMRAGVSVIIDGRNCLRKEDFAHSGILYSGIGRAL